MEKFTSLLIFASLLYLTDGLDAQLMGNGVYWHSGDGGIPQFTPKVDGDVSDMKTHGYHLSWSPSDIWDWGNTYGFSREADLESRRIRVYAIDVDNNLYLADGEDPAENGTDADLTTHYYFSWDEDYFYIAADNIDNHYDIIENRQDGPNDDAFWQRDTFWITFDLSNGSGPNNGNNIVDFRAMPVDAEDHRASMQIQHFRDGEGTQVNYGDDPDYFLGAQLFGGPTARGYYLEARVPWDLIFLFAPELRGDVGEGFAFSGRFIILDPDGDDLYGQTYFGGDQHNLGENNRWPQFFLIPTPGAVGGGCGEDNPPFLSMPDLEGREKDTVTFPVNLDRASLVAGGDFTISYDPSLLSLQEVRNGDLTSGGDFVVISNTNEEDVAIISIAGSRLIGIAEGSLLELEFQAGEFQFGQTNTGEVRFQRAALVNEIGDLMCADWQNGSFTLQLGLPGDVNQDGSITSADAILVLRSAVGLITLDATQRVLGDVNEDGRIGSGDAVLILRKVVGLIPKVLLVRALSSNLGWGVPEERIGEEVVVPLLLGEEIHGVDGSVTYDPETWKVKGLREAEREALWVWNANTPGKLNFTAASMRPLTRVELVLEAIGHKPDDVLLSLEEASAVDRHGRVLQAEISSREARRRSGLLPRYQLFPNYPNPFNPETHITYLLPRQEEISLEVFGLNGQLVRTLESGVRSTGKHILRWDGKDESGQQVGSGVYLLRWQAGGFVQTRRMVLLR